METTCQTATDAWCYTRVDAIQSSFRWTIEKFPLNSETLDKVMTSSTFCTGPNDATKWCVNLHPRRAEDDASNDFLTLSLCLTSSGKKEIRAKFKFSILDSNSEETNQLERACTFRQGECFICRSVRRAVLLDKANGLLPGDKLTIRCAIWGVVDAVNLTEQPEGKVLEHRLAEDFGHLLENQMMSDVTLLVGGETFRVHRSILAARSSVFAAIFEREAQWKRSRVEIADVGQKAMREMLRFIYTGKATSVEKMPAELFVAADKYELEGLKQMCAAALCKRLSGEDGIVLGAERLNEHVMDACSSESVGWENLSCLDPHLCYQTRPSSPPLKRSKRA